QALEAVDRAFDRLAASVELGLGLLGQQPRFVGRIRYARLVAEQTGGYFLELVERLEMLADALADAVDVAGDVAALHRQRSAIARNCADRIFRDFLNPRSGHVEAQLPKYSGAE